MKGNLKDPLLQHNTKLNSSFNIKNNYLNRKSSDESIKEGYFWANIDSTWTILDQKRLVSMDYLYHRSLEFHNNHHTFRATGDYNYTIELGEMNLNEIAYEIYLFEKNRFIIYLFSFCLFVCFLLFIYLFVYRYSSQPRLILCQDVIKYLTRFKLPEE